MVHSYQTILQIFCSPGSSAAYDAERRKTRHRKRSHALSCWQWVVCIYYASVNFLYAQRRWAVLPFVSTVLQPHGAGAAWGPALSRSTLVAGCRRKLLGLGSLEHCDSMQAFMSVLCHTVGVPAWVVGLSALALLALALPYIFIITAFLVMRPDSGKFGRHDGWLVGLDITVAFSTWVANTAATLARLTTAEVRAAEVATSFVPAQVGLRDVSAKHLHAGLVTG